MFVLTKKLCFLITKLMQCESMDLSEGMTSKEEVQFQSFDFLKE